MRRAHLSGVPFVEFVTSVLGVRLTAGQRVMCRVCFDGVEPKDLDAADRAIAQDLFGQVDLVPPLARAVVVALVGARSGKSYLGSLRLLHLGLTSPLRTLAPGEMGYGLLVAPDQRLAKHDLRYISGAIERVPAIKRLVVGETADSITLRRPDGRVVTVECLPATRGGSAVRGRSLFGALLDEACFFRDADFVVNDEELYRAIAPRVLPDGQFIIASTPWIADVGLLMDLHAKNYGTPITAVAVHASTLQLRDDEHTRDFVAREYQRDPENAAREFGAQPMTAGSSAFFDPVAIKACTYADDQLVQERSSRFDRAWAALDTAFRRDASAIVVVRALPTGSLNVAEVAEIAPPKGGKLVPSETIVALIARAKHHRCESVVSDGHYVETVREYASDIALVEAPAGLPGKVEAHLAARRALAEGWVRVPAGQTKLLSQLREIVSKPTSGGGISIQSPRRAGSHGDIASAFVLAVWAAKREAHVGTPKIERANVGVGFSETTTNPFERDYGGNGRRATHDWNTGTRLFGVRRNRGPFS